MRVFWIKVCACALACTLFVALIGCDESATTAAGEKALQTLKQRFRSDLPPIAAPERTLPINYYETSDVVELNPR